MSTERHNDCPHCDGSGVERHDAGLGELCPVCKGRPTERPAVTDEAVEAGCFAAGWDIHDESDEVVEAELRHMRSILEAAAPLIVAAERERWEAEVMARVHVAGAGRSGFVHCEDVRRALSPNEEGR